MTIPDSPINTAAAWLGVEQSNRGDWINHLSKAEKAGLGCAIRSYRATPRQWLHSDRRLSSRLLSGGCRIRLLGHRSAHGRANASRKFCASRPLSARLLELIHSIANHDGLYLDMDFERGDMRFLKNAVILHARRECEDWNEPERKRHLLRQWLTNNSFKGGGALRCAKAYGLRKRHDT